MVAGETGELTKKRIWIKGHPGTIKLDTKRRNVSLGNIVLNTK